MDAQTLNCPMCGAAAATDATKCQHCGARLATISCPVCFGMMFRGAAFCSHCGARANRQEVVTETIRRCPRCRVNTNAVVIGKASFRECARCEGLWADTDSLQQICADREQQAAVLGVATRLPTTPVSAVEKVQYLPCPVCRQLMHRVNFARCSNVVVDVCKTHGTWFDKDEMRRIVEFIRAGGMEKARTNEITELEQKRRELNNARAYAANNTTPLYGSSRGNAQENALSALAAALMSSLID